MSSPAPWPIAVRLYLASFLVVGLALSVLGPALTVLRERSGSGIGDIGILFPAQSFGYISGSYIGGRLFDRYPGHRVFTVSLAVLATGLFLVPMFDGLTGLAVMFVIVGLGAAVSDLGANTMLMWQLGAGSGRAMNLLHLCFGFGALAAPLVVHIGLGLAMRGAALLCFALAGWAYTIPSPVRPEVARDEHTHTTRPLLFALGLFFLLYVGLEAGFAGWIKTYGEEIDFSELAATWLTTTFWIGFTLGRLAASMLAHRVRPDVMLASASGASVVAALVLVVGDGGTAAVWGGTALMGLATAPQFAGMILLAERRIHVTGSVTAWFVGGAGVGGLVFPWTIGRFFDAHGATALPWAVLVIGVALFGSFVAANRALSR